MRSLRLAAAPASAYDAEAGRQKAEAGCARLPRPGGNSANPAVPSIAGQCNDYIVLALYQFRAGHRPSRAMAPLAAPLTDDDLGNLAAYYSAQNRGRRCARRAPTAAAARRPWRGKDNCVQCHGPALPGRISVPRIAGQQIDS